MRRWVKFGRSLMVFLMVASPLAEAALPDPMAFARIVERNNVEQVRSWFNEGLDPEFVGAEIGTGLMIAAWNGHIPMMALFIEHGANPRRANRNGEQPLQLAAWNNHVEAVKWLLDHGAVLNRDGNYWGALHYAVFNGHTDLARYLISRGADVNAKSQNGSTPIMMAAREGRDELAKLLLSAGADLTARNDWGDSALTLAMRYDHYHLGKMIATEEEFAVAVKAPKETHGEPRRSAAAPSEIEEVLRQIRDAEAASQPTEELRKKLMTAVGAFRQSSLVISNARRPMPVPFQSRSLVITARRGAIGNERAQVVVDGKAVPTTTTAGAINVNPASAAIAGNAPARPTAGRVAELMRQIRLAESQGRPADDLRKQLFDAVEQMKP